MSHALTDRQREYLEFIREYIKQNECAPQLKEIAAHFHVTSPTVTKALTVLQEKGYLYFNRDRETGFYIRLWERKTTLGNLREISILGLLDQNGEVLQFPKYHGHFPYVLPKDTGDVFAIKVDQHIPIAEIYAGDKLIVATGVDAKPGDIYIFPIGERNFLVRMYQFSLDEDTPFSLLVSEWRDSADKYKNHLLWWPLTFAEENEKFFIDLIEKQPVKWQPIPPHLVLGKVIRLNRKPGYTWIF
jgi:SOS-response transcriptional repressor LexA